MQGNVGNALSQPTPYRPCMPRFIERFQGTYRRHAARRVVSSSILLSPSHQLTRRIHSIFKGQGRAVVALRVTDEMTLPPQCRKRKHDAAVLARGERANRWESVC